MEYVYAALLLHSAGQEVNAEGIKKVLTAAKVKANDAMIEATVAALDGVDIEEAITSAAQVAVAPAAAAAPAGDAGAAPAGKTPEETAEEEEKTEEEAASGLASLFG